MNSSFEFTIRSRMADHAPTSFHHFHVDIIHPVVDFYVPVRFVPIVAARDGLSLHRLL
jgi:hypothetical protein